MKQSSATLQTHWKHGFAEYISSDFGDGLTTFADADFAHDLRSRRSASSHFQWHCGSLGLQETTRYQPTFLRG